MKKYLIAVVMVMMLCGVASAEKYEISKEQNQFLLQVLANADIKGANAPMLLQVAQALQKPINETPTTKEMVKDTVEGK